MSVKLELYRVFKEVAEAGNITAAAQTLFISQSAVSQSIKQLEAELQTRLFARNSRGVTLTADGRMLYEYVRSAMGLLRVVVAGAERRPQLSVVHGFSHPAAVSGRLLRGPPVHEKHGSNGGDPRRARPRTCRRTARGAGKNPHQAAIDQQYQP